jgi:hypothetical protein
VFVTVSHISGFDAHIEILASQKCNIDTSFELILNLFARHQIIEYMFKNVVCWNRLLQQAVDHRKKSIQQEPKLSGSIRCDSVRRIDL